MSRKLYSISELISENIKLKKKLERQEISHLSQMIFMAENLKPEHKDGIIRALKQNLEDLK